MIELIIKGEWDELNDMGLNISGILSIFKFKEIN
jgi:hypothetical protein